MCARARTCSFWTKLVVDLHWDDGTMGRWDDEGDGTLGCCWMMQTCALLLVLVLVLVLGRGRGLGVGVIQVRLLVLVPPVPAHCTGLPSHLQYCLSSI